MSVRVGPSLWSSYFSFESSPWPIQGYIPEIGKKNKHLNGSTVLFYKTVGINFQSTLFYYVYFFSNVFCKVFVKIKFQPLSFYLSFVNFIFPIFCRIPFFGLKGFWGQPHPHGTNFTSPRATMFHHA